MGELMDGTVLPLSEAEIAAGLDCLDEPWPSLKMERRFAGVRGRAWDGPFRPSDFGGPVETYVPAGDRRQLVRALMALDSRELAEKETKG